MTAQGLNPSTEVMDQKPSSVEFENVSESPANDQAMAVYQSWTDEHRSRVERSLVRKIDRRILPLLVIMYLLNYMDRTSVSQARLYNMQQDLGLTGSLWQTGIAILSVSYILTQLPATLVMARSKPSILLVSTHPTCDPVNALFKTSQWLVIDWRQKKPCCMLLWGIVSACTGATSNVAGYLGVRFCLGLVEGPFFPSSIYFFSCWYRKSEMGIRIALLMSGLVSSQAFAGLISAGVLKGMDGATKLAAWRWLFIIEGLVTIVLAAIAFFTLPDYPATTEWLSEDERICGMCRLADDVGSDDLLQEDPAISRAVIMAVKDYRVWLFACLQMANTACISFSYFFPTLINDLGFYNNTMVLLISSPPYILGFASLVGVAFYTDRVQVRSIPAAISMSIAVVAVVVIVALKENAPWARYAMLFPLVCGVYTTYCITYTWLSSTIVRPPVKRAAAIGIANTFANSAVLFGNYFWLDKYAPTYAPSWGCIIAFGCVSVMCLVSLRSSLVTANKKFDKLEADTDIRDPIQLQRLTEVESRAVLSGFRYVA